MENEQLLKAYVFARRGFKARDALNIARARIAEGIKQYGSSEFYPAYAGAYYNPPLDREKGLARGQHIRWVEAADKLMRFVGYADDVAKAEGFSRSIEHKGWFANEDCDEVYRGVVYQLPARKGKPVFVYGYADPNNEGCALLCFDNDAEDKLEAARMADRFAEMWAEQEREYQEAWRAGETYRETLPSELAELRHRFLKLATAPLGEGLHPRLDRDAATTRWLTEIAEEWCGVKKKREDLLATYGKQPGFAG